MRSSTETLIKAMRILSSDIQSDDGVANAAIAEAAQRLEDQQERIKRLEEVGDAVMKSLSCGCPHGDSVFHCQTCTNSWDAWHKAKEAKL
jgi:hypothetical protein